MKFTLIEILGPIEIPTGISMSVQKSRKLFDDWLINFWSWDDDNGNDDDNDDDNGDDDDNDDDVDGDYSNCRLVLCTVPVLLA